MTVKIEHLVKRIVTTTCCDECSNEVTEKFCGHWSCNTCNAWVEKVTQTQKPFSILNDVCV